MKAVVTFLLGFGLIISPNSPANESTGDVQLFEQALERMAKLDMEAWAYTRSRVGRDGERVDRHDPTLPGADHWQLVSIDGRAPTPDELVEYTEDRVNHADDSEDSKADGDLTRMIVPGSIVFEEETKQGGVYTFLVQSPDGEFERAWSKLRGRLRVSSDEFGPYVNQVYLWIDSPVWPTFGVRFNEMTAEIDMMPVGDGHFLPGEMKVRLVGRVLLVKKIDLDFRISFSDAELVGH